MKCECGNIDINKFVIFFLDNNSIEDATTIPRFLLENLENTDELKKIKKIVCHNETSEGLCLKEVKPTEYGVC